MYHSGMGHQIIAPSHQQGTWSCPSGLQFTNPASPLYLTLFPVLFQSSFPSYPNYSLASIYSLLSPVSSSTFVTPHSTPNDDHCIEILYQREILLWKLHNGAYVPLFIPLAQCVFRWLFSLPRLSIMHILVVDDWDL